MTAPPRKPTTWQRHEMRRAKHYRAVRRAVALALNDQIAPVLGALAAGIQVTDTLILPGPISRIFRGIYVRVGADFAEFTYSQIALLKRANPERKTLFERAMEQFALTETAERITGITETSKAFVRAVLAKGASEGWSIPRIAAEMRRRWNVLTRSRAVTIARTEIITASGQGALAGAREATRATGIRLNKRWLSTRDSRTRDTHRSANGQTVAMDEDFTINGYAMSAPGDTSKGAPAGEVVRCRCSVTFQRAKG